MKNICLNLQIHQAFRLKNFNFLEIGNGKDYYDEEMNGSILREVADKCYLPTNEHLLEMINLYGQQLNISFSISGTALDQFEKYMPEVIESFQKLSETGCVEFLGEPYGHSLAALKSRREFSLQTKAHSRKIEMLFGQKPLVFRNNELDYTDAIEDILYGLGFRAILLEGSNTAPIEKGINRIYHSVNNPDLRVLIKNHLLSGDFSKRSITENGQEQSAFLDNSVDWGKHISEEDQVINLSMSYEAMAAHHRKNPGVPSSLHNFVEKFLLLGFQFAKPSQVYPVNVDDKLSPSSMTFGPACNQKTSVLLGNDMQQEAIYSLYDLEELVSSCHDPKVQRDWLYLQTSDHFYYMSTISLYQSDIPLRLNPYDSPFKAFINYMNILSDFRKRLEKISAQQQPLEGKVEKLSGAAYLYPSAVDSSFESLAR